MENNKRQLSDRFDFVVNMGRPPEYHDAVKRILSPATYGEKKCCRHKYGASVLVEGGYMYGRFRCRTIYHHS